MKAIVHWKQDLTFVGSADSGYPVQIDAEEILGGNNSGVRPMELLALGLAGCAAMDVISILRKKRQDVTQFDVRVDARRSNVHPKVFTGMVITYIITGRRVEEIAVLRSIELAATKYCSAQFMFAQVVPIDLQYEIYEDEGESEKRLIHQGIWQEVLPE
jgi:putative redox protein